MNCVPLSQTVALLSGIALCLSLSTHGVRAEDRLQSTTTYQKAYGQSKGTPKVDPQKELPRYPAVEPAQAVATWKIKPGFTLQLAAHEPQVRDPIALCFDERGRMFVCEMIDYSEQRDANPHLGRISVLEDLDGDGIYETSRVFADNLPWPTGLLWANGGLYVIATPDIWRFEDRSGRGVADHREILFTGFGTGLKLLNVQGLANSMQWGPDQRIHLLAGSGNRGSVSCPRRPDLPAVELGGNDFWFDPLSLAYGLEPGGAQYGMSFDDFGRKFGCANSDHLQHWTYQPNGPAKNPHQALPPSRTSIAKDGGAAEVYRISPDEPWRIIRSRWRISGAVPGMVEGGGRVSGYFTGATGTTIFRGDAYGPDFKNNSFTGDAGGQLIHRKLISPAPDGVGLSGERPADEQHFEFAASRDTWVRVVNFANAPDGCLHVCDMYREVIEHPWSIPDEIKTHLDLNNGNDRGRIYRIAPANPAWQRRSSVRLDKASIQQLVDTLAHPNGWHRDTASRLLFEKHDPASFPLLQSLFSHHTEPLARLHALNLLHALGALREELLATSLSDAHPAVRERALWITAAFFANKPPSPSIRSAIASSAASDSPRIRFQTALTLASITTPDDPANLTPLLCQIARTDHAHRWTGPAVLSAHPNILSHSLLPFFASEASLLASAPEFIASLLRIRAASQPVSDRAAQLDFILQHGSRPAWIQALSTGLASAGSSLEKADADGRLSKIFTTAASRAVDPKAPAADRLAALELLSAAPPSVATAPLLACLTGGTPEQLQLNAIRQLGADPAPNIPVELIARWNDYPPAARALTLTQLLQRPRAIPALLTAIADARIPATALDPSQIQTLIKHKDPAIATQARSALAGVIPPSRDIVTAKFQPSLDLPGDAARGMAVYQRACVICHRAAGQGTALGPDLLTVKNKGRPALLTAILDPNKEVATQYMSFTVRTRSGESHLGMIIEDNATQLTLLMPGGITKTLLRADVVGTSSDGRSLMPEGLEGALSLHDMADLLTFIESLQ